MSSESSKEQLRTSQLVGMQTCQHVPGFSRELEFILFLCLTLSPYVSLHTLWPYSFLIFSPIPQLAVVILAEMTFTS